MLGRNFRFNVKNDAGVTLVQNKVTIQSRKWKGSSDGTVAFEAAEEQLYINDATAGIADAAYEAGDAFNNSGTADEWEGGAFELKVVATAGTWAGNVEVYYQDNTDGTPTDWPDNGNGHLCCVLAVTTTLTGTNTATFVKMFSL